MPTWAELDQDFRDLAAVLQHCRLDYQWGVTGVSYEHAACGVNNQTRRFETLAHIAGVKLQELPAGVLNEAVMQRDKPMERWYEALKHHANGFQHGFMATQCAADGTVIGHIFTGSLHQPASASGVLALQLSAVPIPAQPAPQPVAAPREGLLPRVEDWLRREAKARGYLWIFVAFLVSLLLTVFF